MGWDINWHHFTYVTFSYFFILLPLSPQKIHGLLSYDPQSLDSIIHDYAMEALLRHYHTGTLINVSLPSNFSGMEAKVLTLRSSTLWEGGANLSYFTIPSRVKPFQFVKRVAMVYQNLGNWSNSYYKIPGFSLVAPVVGLVPYNASSLNSVLRNNSLRLSALGKPIYVSFPSNVVGNSMENLKCVKFIDGGLVQFSNLTKNNMCLAQGDGHFSLAIPVKSKENKFKNWKWWVVGFVVGLIGFILLGLIGIMSFKIVKSGRVKKMEGESENGVAFDTSYVMGARMPSASMVRTQPQIEHRDVP